MVIKNISSIKKITDEEYKKRFNNKTKGEYTITNIYKNSRTNITIKHSKCDNLYEVNPRQFIRTNFQCPVCSDKVINNFKFKEKLKKCFGEDMVLLTPYKNARTKVEVLHKPCGYKRKVLPSTALRWKCPKCSKNLLKTTEQFKGEVFKCVGEEYLVLGEYVSGDERIKIKHNKCGHIYKVKPHSFTGKGDRCPKCRESKGEKKTTLYLDKNNFKYKTQYTFKNLKGKKKRALRFDFAVFNSDNTFNCLIEYDGVLHYLKTSIGDLEEIRKSDKIKNDYCSNNNIKLIRIPYWDYDNIDIVLNKELTVC